MLNLDFVFQAFQFDSNESENQFHSSLVLRFLGSFLARLLCFSFWCWESHIRGGNKPLQILVVSVSYVQAGVFNLLLVFFGVGMYVSPRNG